MMDILNDVLGILFPPFCVHCGKLLDFRQSAALCQECEKLWSKEKDTVCKDCFKSVGVCECVPHRASKKIKKTFHLVEYDPGKESVARSLILTCKDHNYKFVYDLVANELEAVLRQRFKNFKNTVITYVPRKKDKVLRMGVDQSEQTAKELAERLGLEFVTAIRRKGGKEQKALDSRERMENAALSYEARSDSIVAVSSRAVILYDDVMTTGASVSACAEILKTMGARSVYVISLGRVYRKGKPFQELNEQENDN